MKTVDQTVHTTSGSDLKLVDMVMGLMGVYFKALVTFFLSMLRCYPLYTKAQVSRPITSCHID